MDLRTDLVAALAELHAPSPDSGGGDKKNYTERVSRLLTGLVAARLRDLGLVHVRAPARGPDKQFMGGYGPKGVDVYLSDEKHGLLLSSGTKGLLFDVRKNLKNRYRDMAIEVLELHKRFPYAVCGHLFFLGKTDTAQRSKAYGTVLEEARVLMTGITGRRRPEEPPEIYEATGVLVFEPGEPDSVDMAPKGLPKDLQAAGYCERLAGVFRARNPFYRD